MIGAEEGLCFGVKLLTGFPEVSKLLCCVHCVLGASAQIPERNFGYIHRVFNASPSVVEWQFDSVEGILGSALGQPGSSGTRTDTFLLLVRS